MAIDILVGSTRKGERSTEEACLVCTTSDTVFGPLFASLEEAEAFLYWLAPIDPRDITPQHVERKVSEFRVYIAEKVEERERNGRECYACSRCGDLTKIPKHPESVYELYPSPELTPEERVCLPCWNNENDELDNADPLNIRQNVVENARERAVEAQSDKWGER